MDNQAHFSIQQSARPIVKIALWGILGLMALTFNLYPPAASAEETTKTKLERLERELAQHQQTQQDLERQNQELTAQTSALQRGLVALAARIQNRETTLATLEKRVQKLHDEERQKTSQIERRMSQMSGALAGLQRLSQRPPVTLIGQPGAAKNTIQTSLLLGHIIPVLKTDAQALGAELRALQSLRLEISARNAEVNQETNSLFVQQQEITTLLEEKGRRQQALKHDSAREAEQLKKIASEAKNLKALLQQLAKQERTRATEDASQRLGAQQQAKTGQDFTLPNGSQPFSTARGTLPLPARGRLVRLFGQSDELGQPSKGITIQTRAGAQVVAPYDGRIVFAGEFRGYGLLLIITHGEGYHTLLAGLSQIFGDVGQWLLAGEPIGSMMVPDLRGGSKTQPTLYVEFRRQGEPINPMIWLAASEKRTNG